VDVGIDWGDEKIAIEIALGPNLDKEMTNLIKDLECGWDTVVFATLTDNEENQLRNMIADRFGAELLKTDKVGFVRLSRFLETQPKKTESNRFFWRT